MTALKTIIEDAFEAREKISSDTKGPIRDAVDEVMAKLDDGTYRIAEKKGGDWVVHAWLKQAVLLSFRLWDMKLMYGATTANPASPEGVWYDKMPSKFDGWKEENFKAAGIRAVPGSIVRKSAFIGKGTILMPSFVNLGAYVDSGVMVDTWATVGSCAQIGKNVHISGGAGIGGVLEPLQANPVIIEDNCFIGARSEVAEGVIVREGSVLSMGVYLGASTKIIDRTTGEIFMGEVPPYSVVVPGSIEGKPLQNGESGPSLYAAVIVKRVDQKTREKTSVNALLRDL